MGKGNAGNCNSGNWNSGNWNSGSWNSGSYNSGSCNTGNCNSGNWNASHFNAGYYNSGYGNTGDYNSGNYNSCNRNTGNWNSGYGNSGNWNSGSWNSGDWNKTNYSSGCFNTIEPKVMFFNKKSNWTYVDWLKSDAKRLLGEIPTETLQWIAFKDMTEEEKEAKPEAKSTKGYLKVIKPKMSVQEWWESLCPTDKDAILGIPNFNRKIFKEITGIDVGEIENYNAKEE